MGLDSASVRRWLLRCNFIARGNESSRAEDTDRRPTQRLHNRPGNHNKYVCLFLFFIFFFRSRFTWDPSRSERRRPTADAADVMWCSAVRPKHRPLDPFSPFYLCPSAVFSIRNKQKKGVSAAAKCGLLVLFLVVINQFHQQLLHMSSWSLLGCFIVSVSIDFVFVLDIMTSVP